MATRWLRWRASLKRLGREVMDDRVANGAAAFAFYMVLAIDPMLQTDWAGVSATSWLLMVASSLLALAVAYMIWYTGVQRIGSARTSLYSNLTPVVAMAIGAVVLGERIGAWQIAGAALILGGLAVARRVR